MTLQPGIHAIDPSDYHADPCPLPSLSSGGARWLLTRSPMHAHYNHPRLGGGSDEPPTRAMTDGSLIHLLMVGKGAEVVAIDAADFKTKAAQTARDAALAADMLPVLTRHWTELQAVAEAALMQMRDHPACDAFFAPGRSEAVLIWKEGRVWCRAMIDRLPDAEDAPWFDLKSTGMSAHPDDYGRTVAATHAFQVAFYQRGLRAVFGPSARQARIVVLETAEPHAISVMACAPELLAVAEAEVDRAIALWDRCMSTGKWPGYQQNVAYVDAPAWMLAQSERRMEEAA